jgi:signal transduction histidine kinase
MKMRATIKRKIFAFNVFTVILLLLIIAVTFNVFARFYMENETLNQLRKVAQRVEDETRRDLFMPGDGNPSPLIGSYMLIFRTVRQPHFMSNTEVALIDKDNQLFVPREFRDEPSAAEKGIVSFILAGLEKKTGNEITFLYEGKEYAAVVVSLRKDLPVNVSKLVIYTSMDKISEMQQSINLILLAVSILAALIVTGVSSYLSKKISTPISTLCAHIRDLSERQFRRIHIPADDEILELVNNINTMTEKLESHDQAQKTFLQNVSHEFRTPIMSIRSYAEGIQYGVVENSEAVRIILDETARLTQLVESLLYLSRLDTMEESYHMELLDFHELLHFCAVRMQAIARKQGKEITIHLEPEALQINGDGEKLTRAITNLLDNSIRYAEKDVNLTSMQLNSEQLELSVSDDGPGFDPEDLKQLFTRFYKGKQGHFGLGLSITKSIMEKHNGSISAGNDSKGAVIKVVLPIAAVKNHMD